MNKEFQIVVSKTTNSALVNPDRKPYEMHHNISPVNLTK